MSFVVTDADIMSGNAKWTPGDVEPAGAGQELVGQGVVAQKIDEQLELGWILGTDVGGLALKMLRVLDTANLCVHLTIAEAAVDQDGAADGFSGGFQQVATAIGHVGNLLDGGDVLWVLLQVAELCQRKMRR